MRRAADITAEAHVRAMSATQARHARVRGRGDAPRDVPHARLGAPGLRQHRRLRAERDHPALPPEQPTMEDGELLLIDAGCEYDYYASDVTRTFPVSGKFSEAAAGDLRARARRAGSRHREDAQRARSLEEIHAAVRRRDHARPRRSSASSRARPRPAREGARPTSRSSCTRPVTGSAWTCTTSATTTSAASRAPLEPGMVLTVEPGIYIAQDNDKVAPRVARHRRPHRGRHPRRPTAIRTTSPGRSRRASPKSSARARADVVTPRSRTPGLLARRGALAVPSGPSRQPDAVHARARPRPRDHPHQHPASSAATRTCTASVGLASARGLRFNNPYRLRTVLGDDAESLSRAATYLDLALRRGARRPARIAARRRAALSRSRPTASRRRCSARLTRRCGRFGARWLVLARAGVPVVLEPDLNAGFELAAGGAFLLGAAVGIGRSSPSACFTAPPPSITRPASSPCSRFSSACGWITRSCHDARLPPCAVQLGLALGP